MSIRSDGSSAERGTRSAYETPRTVRVGMPAAHTEMVERRHLVDVLRRGARGPVTLLSAPAGFGKTVLVGAWTSLIDPSVPVAHMTMREDDESPAVFWASAIEALRAAGIDVSGEPAPAASEGIDQPMLAGLIRSINAHGGPVVWVLDCGEFALAPGLGDGLHRVIEGCLEELHLVLVTRADPPLPLHRYRLARQLTEIRAADLVFTASEASALLQRAGLDLAPLDAVILRSRTGGWPAGLQFAAMSLAGRVDVAEAIREFRGDAGNVAAFLTTEVYAKQPPRIQEFLLRTCIVDEMSPELAAALTGQDRRGGSAAVRGPRQRLRRAGPREAGLVPLPVTLPGVPAQSAVLRASRAQADPAPGRSGAAGRGRTGARGPPACSGRGCLADGHAQPGGRPLGRWTPRRGTPDRAPRPVPPPTS